MTEAAVAPPPLQPAYRALQVGDPAPWFRQKSTSNPDFAFDTVAGRYIVLCFYGTGADEIGRGALAAFQEQHRSLFDDDKIALFGVSVDPADLAQGRAKQILPGIRHFWDFDGKVGRLYGALPHDASGVGGPLRRFWMVLNPTLRVRAIFPFKPDGSDSGEVAAYLRALPPVVRFAGFEIPAPVLVIPDVFEPEFCRHLIGLYEEHGGQESGFMREVDGKTVATHDRSHKSRKDFTITDQGLMQQIQKRIVRRVNPEIEKVHFFKPTRMERYIVSCYAAEDGGHFRAHRDNTTKGTAHRRFAVSINLNADFDGGEVSFPEYGPRSYKAPPGGAVVFSCPLLHAVSAVTRGRRYAFLPFIYDDEAARIREANNAHLGEGVGAYKVQSQP
jgi:predicted 2-oxoglutarate/Fe(II)-dependent dioxygenase YbiX/peroxiredoxin